MQQEQEHLALETELTKSKAKEQVLSSIIETAPCSFVPNPIRLEFREGERKVAAPIIRLETKALGANGPLTVTVGCSTLKPKAAEWHQHLLATNKKECAALSEHSGASSSPSERAFHEMLGLHHHQNVLQQQQNKIVESDTAEEKQSSPATA